VLGTKGYVDVVVIVNRGREGGRKGGRERREEREVT
jgi:hypothetical protein